MAEVPRRLSTRRRPDDAVDVGHNGLIRRLAGPAVTTVLAGAFIVALILGRAPTVSDPPTATRPPPQVEPPVPGPVEVQPGPFEAQVNQGSGFEFTVPENWDVRQDGALTSLANPSDRIVVTLGPGSAGRLKEASARLLDSLLDRQSNQELIGRTWDRIAGSRSLLVGGTADQGGRSVRFLAITVRGQPRNYSITISVPEGSDPARVLPRLERIVTSLEVRGSSPEIFAH